MNAAAQILLSSLAGLVFGWVILLMARRGIMSMRYTLGWFFVAGCLIIGGALGRFANPLARALGVEPISVILAIGMTALLAITVQLSISASGLTELVRTLAESQAILEERMERYEAQQTIGMSEVTE